MNMKEMLGALPKKKNGSPLLSWIPYGAKNWIPAMSWKITPAPDGPLTVRNA